LRRIDLSHTLLSPETLARWQEVSSRVVALIAERLALDPATIPDERAGVLRNGSLKIFVSLALADCGIEISITVPPEH
jgi:hypothetical protein